MPNIRRAATTGLTEQQERFSELVAAGMDLPDAFLEAGYRLGPGNDNPAKIRQRATNLTRKPHVAARIAELRAGAEPLVQKAVSAGATRLVMDAIDRQRWVRDMLMRVAERALGESNYDAVLDSVRLLGADAGMWQVPGAEPALSGQGSARKAAVAAAQIGAAAAGGVLAGADIMDRLRQEREKGRPPTVIDGQFATAAE